MPGRRRAASAPFEESGSLTGAGTAASPDDGTTSSASSDATGEQTRAIGGAHSRPPLSGAAGRPLPPGTSGGSHANSARPAARPATRAPALPQGPVLLPSSERPAARPPGARRADGPTLVGPDAASSPAGRRIAVPPPTASNGTLRKPVQTTAQESAQESAQGAARKPAQAPAPSTEPAADGVTRSAPAEQVRAKSAPARPEPARRSATRGRSRQRTRGWLADRPAPADSAPESRTTAPVRKAVAEPEADRARIRFAARSRPSRTQHNTAVLPGTVPSWLAVVAAGSAGVLAVRLSPDLPDLLGQVSAALITVAFALGLAVRTGGRPIWAAGLSGALVAVAIATGSDALLAGASVSTGVLTATLAVMATTPAPTFAVAIREALIATVIAAVGGFGVIGYGPQGRPEVDVDKFGYVVLGLSLAGAFALVYRLGAGLHGLGRRGYAVAAGAVFMLILALAYSEAIAQWGSRDLVGSLDDLRDSTRATFGAVAHPIVALLGYPALLWGVFMRARRRQGWWVSAFGVAATAPTATRLVASDVGLSSVLLGGAYSLGIGIVVGYLVIRAEQFFTGSHGRRARRDEEAVAHRPEPRRTHPLH